MTLRSLFFSRIHVMYSSQYLLYYLFPNIGCIILNFGSSRIHFRKYHLSAIPYTLNTSSSASINLYLWFNNDSSCTTICATAFLVSFYFNFNHTTLHAWNYHKINRDIFVLAHDHYFRLNFILSLVPFIEWLWECFYKHRKSNCRVWQNYESSRGKTWHCGCYLL